MTTVATLTARQVEQALWLHFTGSSWAPISEVTITPPGARDLQYGDPRATPRRIDMLMVRSARKPERDGAIDRLAVEIKVSRADFLSDIAVPEKQAPWREFANRHAYAAPAGLIKVEELPEGSGLLEITEAAWGRAVTWVKRAPYANRPPDLPNWLVLAIAHRLAYAEGRIRGNTVRQLDQTTDPDELRAELEVLKAENTRLQKLSTRAAADVKAWRAAAVREGLPCGTCRELLKPKSLRHGHISGWKHASKSDEATCELLRAEQAGERARERYAESVAAGIKLSPHRAADYGDEPWRAYLYVPAPEPVESTEDL